MERDSFILPSSEKGKVILFSPLRKKAILIENNNETINRMLEKWRSINVNYPNDITTHVNHSHVILLLTQSCNLSCEYCYSRLSRSNEVMDLDVLIKVIEHVLSYSQKGTRRFSFGGGGEPLMAWELLVKGIKYIRSNSCIDTTKISLVTNGTLLSKKRIEFLKLMGVNVNISFDILPEIQNRQRKSRLGEGSYELVSKNIRTMNAMGLPVSFRTTITRDSVLQLPDMVKWSKKEFPFVRDLNIWPAIDPKEKSIDFYNDYVDGFIQASELAWPLGIRLHNWLTVTDRFHSRFCQEDFCITPNGEIVTCLRSSAINDPNYKVFHIGSVSDEIVIDPISEKMAMDVLNSKFEECDSCPARWSCAGICPHTRLLLSSDSIRDYCNFSRKFLAQYIEFCVKHHLLSSE